MKLSQISINKKHLAIIVGVIILVVLAAVVYFVTNKPPTGDPGIFPTNTPLSQATVPPSEDIPRRVEEEKVNVSGVEVDNFYKNAIVTGKDGFALFVNERNYKIMYIPIDDSFLISILGRPFSIAKEKAEQVFLKKLGINEEEACDLTVAISTPRSFNPIESGRIYQLSFCD